MAQTKKKNAVKYDRVEYTSELSKEALARGDEFVAINGFAIKIRPGEKVMLPKNFADVLNGSKEADAEALRRRIALQNDMEHQ